jgi:hypothetical protein
MAWNFAAFGRHVTLFPGGLLLLVGALLLTGYGAWTLLKFFRTSAG